VVGVCGNANACGSYVIYNSLSQRPVDSLEDLGKSTDATHIKSESKIHTAQAYLEFIEILVKRQGKLDRERGEKET